MDKITEKALYEYKLSHCCYCFDADTSIYTGEAYQATDGTWYHSLKNDSGASWGRVKCEALNEPSP